MRARPIERDGTDWVAWHLAYDDSSSPHARRLAIVRRHIGAALDHHGGSSVVRVLSLCAGDGRDVLAELAARPWLTVRATLVELDSGLADAARHRAAEATGAAGAAGAVDVRVGDAGHVATFADTLPVDLLLLCGIFGNVAVADIRRTVAAVPWLVAPGATVIWTRGRRAGAGDLRPVIRGWFARAGLREVAFHGEPEPFGVGVARAGSASTSPPTGSTPTRLFGFVR